MNFIQKELAAFKAMKGHLSGEKQDPQILKGGYILNSLCRIFRFLYILLGGRRKY
jgi:hypothetical protein